MAYNSFINKQAGTQSPKFEFKKDQNNSAIVSGDGLGEFNFRAFDGTSYIDTSKIISVSSGTIAANRIGSNLEFWTHPDSVTASTQRMVISSEGNVTINSPVSGSPLALQQDIGGNASINISQSSADSFTAPIRFFKYRGPLGNINSGDSLGEVQYFGRAGGVTDEAAIIQAQAGTITGAFVPSFLKFYTKSTTNVLASRLEIAPDGNVTINAPVSGTALTIAGGGETITAGDLTLSAGNINLTSTSATSGIVNVNSNRFMHSYGTNNTFLGSLAGNLTQTATQNVCVGTSAGNNITTGGNCVYIGYQAGNTVSGGNENTVIGSQAFANANASQNVVIGYQAGNASTGFTACTVVGKFALNNTNGGLYNLMLGYGSGTNYTGGESSNICLHSDGVLGDSNTLRIGQSSGAGNRQLNRAFICGIDNVNVGSVAKVVTMASDQLGTATITAGAGISVTPSANTITIATTNGIAWTEVTGTSQAMAVDSGYIANNASLVTLTLPATAAVGDRVRIAGKGAGGWKCAQNASQTINFGNTATTVGTGGSIDSTNQYDALELLCITANTTWVTLSSVGNLNVV